MHGQLVVIASLVACCLANYPSVLVIYRNAQESDGQYKCCKGSITEHITFNGHYELDGLVVASRLIGQNPPGPYNETVHLNFAQNYGENYTIIGYGTFTGITLPGEDLVVPITALSGGKLIVDAGKDYFVEVGYQLPGLYPYYTHKNVESLGPLANNTAQNGFVIGVEYSKAAY
ncbi:uncharacterized protein [Anabrus simplex]|uniref:uncharacterized protein n=1 Tax=Anabrus simplex TaxID=316456 RepID=UPI0035A39740